MRERSARVRIHVDLAAVAEARLQERVIEAGDPDEDGRPAAGDPIEAQPGVLQPLPGHFEQEALLRVHAGRFPGEMPKKCGSKRSISSTKPPQRL